MVNEEMFLIAIDTYSDSIDVSDCTFCILSVSVCRIRF